MYTNINVYAVLPTCHILPYICILSYRIVFFPQIEDLRRMYDLFSRVPMTLDELRRSMCEYVKATGKALVTDQVGA